MRSARALGRFLSVLLLGRVRTPLLGNGYALVSSSFISSVIGVAYWIAVARIYAPEVVGSSSAAIAAMMFLAGVAQLNLMSALLRFIPTAGARTATFVMFAYLTCIPVAAVVGCIFIAGITIWTPNLAFLGASPWFILWFALGTSSWCIFTLQDGVLTGLHRARWVLVENVIFAVSKLGLLAIFVVLLPENGVFASWTAAMALSIIPTNLLIFLRLIPEHVRATSGQAEPFAFGKVVRYLLGDYVGSLCLLASTTLLALIVAHVAGTAAAAYFYISWQIAFGLILVSTNMGSSLIVEGARDPGQLGAYSLRMMIRTFGIVGPAVVVVVFAAEPILRVFGGVYASEGATLLRLLALAALPNVLTSLGISVLRVQRHTWMVVAISAPLCALSLSLSWVLLEAFGIVGVGLGWLAGQATIALLVTFIQLLPLWRLRSDPVQHGLASL